MSDTTTPAGVFLQYYNGTVVMSTDKSCYRPGEPVNVKATGQSSVPNIGDFPYIFWAVTNASGGPVWETVNPLDAVGTINGTLEGTWNETYRYRDPATGWPVYGGPVPPGTYTIWFYEIPLAPWYPDTWIPTNVTIEDCSSNFTVDAGGPYVATEGTPIALKATVSGAAWNVSIRWDFEDDGGWDTSWSPDFTAIHVYGDDFHGKVRVEARASANASAVDVSHMEPAYFFTTTNHQVSHAQSFVPTAPTLAAVDLDVSINWGTPEDAYYATIRGSLDGPNLTQAHVPSRAIPRPPTPPQCGFEVLFDFPDIGVAPGQTYYIVMTSPGTFGASGVGGNYEMCGTATEYPKGTYWTNDTGRWSDESVYGYPDLRFRTYASGGTETANAAAGVDVSNIAPVILTTVAPNGNEGDSITFSAHVVDPGSDDLAFAWSGDCAGWSAPTTYWNNPAYQPDPLPSTDVHPRDVTESQVVVCGDNGPSHWMLNVTDDDGGTTSVSGMFTIGNLPPSLMLPPPSLVTVDEGTKTVPTATAKDPGSDDLAFTWSWQYGPTETRTYYNDGTGPDPPNSPDGTFPFTASDGSSFTYGDDGKYVVMLVVHDDDGGSLTYTTTNDVSNVVPTVDAGADAATDEGSPIPFTFGFRDPGFDQPAAGTVEDFTATVDWGDGTSEPLAVTEVPGGPGVPTTGTIDATHIFADNGLYAVTVTVCDDDGGCGTDALAVDVANVAPTVDAGPDRETDEATALAFTFSFSDPGFDFPPDVTMEDFTGLVDWGYGAPDTPAVTEVPGGPGVPTTGTISVAHTYGDNGAFKVTVTVCDDDGGCGSDSLVVTVHNADPAILDVQAYVLADLRLRVAGEKWHDVRMDIVWNGGVTGTARVVRYPSSPDDQSAMIEGGRLQLLGDFAITLYYTPDDDPVNGQRNGANPAWVILTMPDGGEVRLHHTFNVQHPATWTWTIDDLSPYIVGQEITFEVTASDVGSDDLTVAWDFGDGGTATATYFNNGVSPDPFPSPEVNPTTTSDLTAHAFIAAGTYTITLTVTDDDGGIARATFTMTIGA